MDRCFIRTERMIIPTGQLTKELTFRSERGLLKAIGTSQCNVCDSNATLQLKDFSGAKLTEVMNLTFLQRGSAPFNEAFAQINTMTDGGNLKLCAELLNPQATDTVIDVIFLYDASSSDELNRLFNNRSGNCLIG